MYMLQSKVSNSQLCNASCPWGVEPRIAWESVASPPDTICSTDRHAQYTHLSYAWRNKQSAKTHHSGQHSARHMHCSAFRACARTQPADSMRCLSGDSMRLVLDRRSKAYSLQGLCVAHTYLTYLTAVRLWCENVVMVN